jgi:hypothetical protein
MARIFEDSAASFTGLTSPVLGYRTDDRTWPPTVAARWRSQWRRRIGEGDDEVGDRRNRHPVGGNIVLDLFFLAD